MLFFGRTRLFERAERSCKQAIRNEIIELADDDADAQPCRIQIAAQRRRFRFYIHLSAPLKFRRPLFEERTRAFAHVFGPARKAEESGLLKQAFL